MSTTRGKRAASSQPWLHQEHIEIQRFGTVRLMPLALPHDAEDERRELEIVFCVADARDRGGGVGVVGGCHALLG